MARVGRAPPTPVRALERRSARAKAPARRDVVASRPDSTRQPPGASAARTSRARSTSSGAIRLARTRSKRRGRKAAPPSPRETAQVDAVERGVPAALGDGLGIVVEATTGGAPSRAAATPRMPVPAPTSRTRPRGRAAARSASARRHRRVVSWVPVPKARPGSTIRILRARPAQGEAVTAGGLVAIRPTRARRGTGPHGGAEALAEARAPSRRSGPRWAPRSRTAAARRGPRAGVLAGK